MKNQTTDQRNLLAQKVSERKRFVGIASWPARPLLRDPDPEKQR